MLVRTLSQCVGQHTLSDRVRSGPLGPHLLVDVNNADEQKKHHNKIIQHAERTTQWPRKSLQRGSQRHGGAKSTHCHPQEKQPHQAAHVTQPPDQKQQEEWSITQVILHLEKKTKDDYHFEAYDRAGGTIKTCLLATVTLCFHNLWGTEIGCGDVIVQNK